MKIRADFHIHTHHSSDSGASASAIIDNARRAGLDVIGITDHNTTKGAIEVRNLANGKPSTGRCGGRPLVLVGQEVRTMSGEIIVFGPEKDIPKGLTLAEALNMARAMGGFIVVPHPFDGSRHGLGRDMAYAIEMVDAIETLNSRCLLGRANRKAADFAHENEIPMVAGSDAHFPEEIGSCVTEVEIEGKLTERSVLDAVAAGRTVVAGVRSGLMPHLRTSLRRLRI